MPRAGTPGPVQPRAPWRGVPVLLLLLPPALSAMQLICSPGCAPTAIGNGICDTDCYAFECDFDGGDCDNAVVPCEGSGNTGSLSAGLLLIGTPGRYLNDRYELCDWVLPVLLQRVRVGMGRFFSPPKRFRSGDLLIDDTVGIPDGTNRDEAFFDSFVNSGTIGGVVVRWTPRPVLPGGQRPMVLPFEFIRSGAVSFCSGSRQLTASSGVITSGDADNHEPFASCVWRIINPSPGTLTITLWWESFSLSTAIAGIASGPASFVRIQSGPADAQTIISPGNGGNGRFVGDVRPPTWSTTDEMVTVVFEGGFVVAPGFRARYTIADDPTNLGDEPDPIPTYCATILDLAGVGGIQRLYEAEGSLEDGSGSYISLSSLQVCAWLIVTEPDMVLVITLQSVDARLMDGGGLTLDEFPGATSPLRITSDTEGPQLVEWALENPDAPTVVQSSASMVRVKWTPDSTRADGFRLTWYSVPAPAEPSCSPRTVLTNLVGSFESNLEGRSYTRETRCEFLIDPIGGTHPPTLVFSRYQLSSDDTVEIYDGRDEQSPLLVRLSATTSPEWRTPVLPSPVTPSSSAMFVVFTSGSANVNAGFRASYFSAPFCSGPVDLTGTLNGEISSSPILDDESLAKTYGPNLACSWTIGGLTRAITTVYFHLLDLADAGDALQIFAGADDSGLLLWSSRTAGLPRGDLPAPITTGRFPDNQLHIRFTTNSLGFGRGFRIAYSSGGCGGTYRVAAVSGEVVDGALWGGYRYSATLPCRWLISPVTNDPSARIMARFDDLEFEHLYLSVELFDGHDFVRPLRDQIDAAASLGFVQGFSFASESPTVGISVDALLPADDPVYLRMRLSYEVAAVCGGADSDLMLRTDKSGTITDGGLGDSGTYTLNTVCRWNLKPELGDQERLSIYFESLDLAGSGDVLYIYDGPLNTTDAGEIVSLGTEVAVLDGSELPEQLHSDEGEFTVVFVSDAAEASGGFRFVFHAGSCSGRATLNSPADYFGDNSSPFSYDNDMDCRWDLLPGAPGTRVTLFFTEFGVQVGDFVSVLDDTGNTLLSFSGSEVPTTELNMVAPVSVTFTSDSSIVDVGFRIVYQAGACVGDVVFHSSSNALATGSYGSDGLACSWLLAPQGGAPFPLQLGTSLVDLAEGDSLTVSDPATDAVLAVLDHTSTPGPLALAGELTEVLVTFVAPAGTAGGNGVAMAYDAGVCAGRIALPSDSGSFRSNRASAYASDLLCEWEIRPPSEGALVTLFFSAMDLDAKDTVRVFSSDDDLLLELDGTDEVPPPVTAPTSGPLLVVFDTDSSGVAGGFVASFQAGACASGGDPTLVMVPDGATIEFSDGSAPDAAYLAGLTCVWLVSRPGGVLAELSVELTGLDLGVGDSLVLEAADGSVRAEYLGGSGTLADLDVMRTQSAHVRVTLETSTSDGLGFSLTASVGAAAPLVAGGSDISVEVVVGVVVAVVVVLLVVAAVVVNQRNALYRLASKPAAWQIKYEELELEDPLGEGGFGIVYKGRFRGTDVAVKKLRTEQVTLSMMEEFRAEATIMSELRHPNTVLFMGAATIPPNMAIVLEFMTRGSLYQILHSQMDFSWSFVKKALADVASGMAYLHSASPPILHLDLKSLNVLVDGSWTMKVSDFGLTRFAEETRGAAAADKPDSSALKSRGSRRSDQVSEGELLKEFDQEPGGVLGSVYWMAPELVVGDEPTTAADVYSFAIMIWELCVRDDPYHGIPTTVVTVNVSMRAGYRPEEPEDTPQELVELMTSCWTEEPEKRPSFAEIKDVVKEMISEFEDPLMGSMASSFATIAQTPAALVFIAVDDAKSKWESHPPQFGQALEQYFALTRRVLSEHAGTEVSVDSDLILCVFQSVVGAVKFACDLNMQILEQEWPDGVFPRETSEGGCLLFDGPRLMSGIHYGTAKASRDADGGVSLAGAAVNQAMRVCSVAKAGQTVLTPQAMQALESGGNKAEDKAVYVPLGSKGLVVAYPTALSDRQFLVQRTGDSEVTWSDTGTALSRTSEAREWADLVAAPQWVIDPKQLTTGETIGFGSFGTVFKGNWNGSLVAVKQLFRKSLEEDKQIALKSEIAVASVLRHPNIVQFFGVAIEPTKVSLVMELVDGGSLFHLLTAGPVDPVDKVGILKDVAAGMQYLHGLTPPILHRDLKPKNVLLTSDKTAKLCDFGLARIKASNQTMTRVGTTGYMAKEILQGMRYSEKADVFSFGVLLYESWTQRSAFQGVGTLDIARQIVRGFRPNLPSDMPSEYKKLVHTSWADDPNARPDFATILQTLSAIHFQALPPVRPPKGRGGGGGGGGGGSASTSRRPSRRIAPTEQ